MTEQIEHSERAHALLGGSSASRWLNCPGSVALSRGLPPQLPSKDALEGTKAHELCEKYLESYLDHYLDGSELPTYKEIEEETLKEAVSGYVDTIWEKVFLSSITGKAFKIEDRVEISAELDMFGFIDLWVIYIDDRGKRCGVIVDFKYGLYEVEAANNSQLAYYAVALRKGIQKLGKDLDYIRACIYQPRLRENHYKETKFTKGNLDKWEEKFLKAGENIFLSKKPKFKVGSWCFFCRAQAICKVYQENVTKKSSLKLLDIDEHTFPTIETLSEKDVLKIVLNEKLIKKVLSECKKYAMGRAFEGKCIEGSKVVTARPKRQWKKETDIIVAELEKTGLSDFTTVKVKGITEVEKNLKKLIGEEKVPTVMEGLTQLTTPAPIVVSIDDEREAIRLDSSYLLEDDEIDNE